MAIRPYSETLNEALCDPRDAAAYLEAALQEEDEQGFLLALRTVAEVHGIAEVARKAGIGRESLYKTLKVEPHEMFVIGQETLDKQALRGKLNRLLEQANGEEQLRLIVRLLQAAIH